MSAKNTIIAFVLMIITIAFFNSPFYYKQIRHQPYPYSAQPVKELPGQETEVEKPAAEAPTRESSEPQMTALAPVAPALAPATPADAALQADTIWVETDNLRCGISTRGANIVSLQTKKYHYNYPTGDSSAPARNIELIPPQTEGGNNLQIDNRSYDSTTFSAPETGAPRAISGNDSSVLTFTAKNSDGSILTKNYTFYGTSYRIGCRLSSPYIQGKNVGLGWECGLMESEKIDLTQNMQNYMRYADLSDGKSIDKMQLKKEGVEEKTGFYRWFGMTSKYFLVAVVSEKTRDMDISITTMKDKTFAKSGDKKAATVFNCALRSKINSDSDQLRYWIYAGPTSIGELVSYKVGFEKVLFNGWEWFFWANIWFPQVCEWILWLLIYLFRMFHDYGVAIIALTILSRLITYPLTQSSMKSMNRMKDLQPKINALRAKYKTNAKKMNEELMALYKKEGINPLNPGCLPMFLQMPVFIALFVVLQAAIELRGATSVLLPWIKDLSQPESIYTLPTALPFYGSHVAAMPILMAVLTFFQNKMTIKDPNQKAMIYIMPIFMLVLFNNWSSGIVLYWTFSSALGILQQYLLDHSKKVQDAKAVVPAAAANKVKAGHR